MAEKAKKPTKTKTTTKTSADSSNISKIICLIIGVVAVVAVIFAAVFIINGNIISDSYFVSDGSKLVLTLENHYDGEDALIAPVKSHLVYYYSGENITGVKYYYEFASNEKATESYNELKANDDFDGSTINLNGKYIIFTFPASQYEGTKVEDIKAYLKMLENTSGDTEIEETVEEVTE